MARKTEQIEVRGDHITLGQLLKVCGAARSGGEAKRLLETGAVHVNGKDERRRGRKLRPGDAVKISEFGSFRVAAPAATPGP